MVGGTGISGRQSRSSMSSGKPLSTWARTAPDRRRAALARSSREHSALPEAIVFLEAYGVDTKAAVEVRWGARRLVVLNQKAQKMLDRSFDPGFRIELHHKDLGIVTAAAREAGVVAPLGAVVAN